MSDRPDAVPLAALLALPAGRELDAAVAEHVLGRRPERLNIGAGGIIGGGLDWWLPEPVADDVTGAELERRGVVTIDIGDYVRCPPFSTDIAAAWMARRRFYRATLEWICHTSFAATQDLPEHGIRAGDRIQVTPEYMMQAPEELGGMWSVQLWATEDGAPGQATAPLAPLAICRAALTAVLR